MLAIDTETHLFEPRKKAPKLVSVSIANGNSESLNHRMAGTTLEITRRILQEEPLIAFANAPFDLGVLCQQWPDITQTAFTALEEGRIWDVLLCHRIAALHAGEYSKWISLQVLAKEYLDVELEKEDTWRLRYSELSNTPLVLWPKEAVTYANLDARVTYDIAKKQTDVLGYRKGCKIPDYAAQIRADWALHLISSWGILTDAKKVFDLKCVARKEFEKNKARLIKWGVVRGDGTRNVKKFRQEIEAYFKAVGREPARTKKGAIATSKEVCAEINDPNFQNYVDYSHFQSMLSGTLKDLEVGGIVPIHARFDVLKETGRTSCEKPNLQNLRGGSGVRECFVPRKGNVFIACDYAGAELHTFAQFCYTVFGESKLREELNKKTDVHLLVASQLLRISYEEALARKKTPDVKRARDVAKIANFGFPGGCSAATLQKQAKGRGVVLTLDECYAAKKAWVLAWPETCLFFQFIRDCEMPSDPGSYQIKQIFSERMRTGCSFTAACNCTFQGGAADGAKNALFQVQKAQMLDRSSPLFGTPTVNFVHDEIIIEVPKTANYKTCAYALKNIMVNAFNKFTPDVPVRAEASVMEYWTKDENNFLASY